MTDDEEQALIEKADNIMGFIATALIVMFLVAPAIENAEVIVAWISAFVSQW